MRQQKAQLQNDALSRLRSSLDSLKSMANSVITNGVGKLSSSVSSSAVSASLSPFARAGSVTFTVDQLARAHGLRTATTVASSSSVITSASTFALSTNAVAIGVSSVQAGAGVTPGNYTVSVLQATAGATRTGTSPLAASTLIDGTNNTLNLELDGVATPVTIASGTYDAAGLLGAVKTALVAAGGGATAALDATGRLRLTSTHEGSAATLQVMGGSALAPLGLTDLSAATGTDGSIQIGTQPAVTVTSAGTGASVAVADRERRYRRQARRRSARRRGQRRRGLDRRSQPGECRGGDQRRQRRRQRGRHQGRRRSMDPPALVEPIRHRQRDGARRDRLRWRRRAARRPRLPRTRRSRSVPVPAPIRSRPRATRSPMCSAE